MNPHQRIQETIAAYALHALDDDDRRRAEHDLLEHLPGCAECSAIMLEFRETAGDLGLATDPVAPSRELEQRLLDSIRGERRAYGGAQAGSRRRRFATRFGVAAAMLALVGSAALNVSLVRRLDTADRQQSAIATLVNTIADSNARSVALRGGSGSLSLVYGSRDEAVLVGNAVPRPPSGHVYELWFLDGTAVPIRTFLPNDGNILIALPRTPAGFRGAAITIEKNFVTKPTTESVYAGTLQG